MKILVMLLLILGFTSGAQASDVDDALNYQRSARKEVDEHQWQKARDHAKVATEKAPTSEVNKDAWLLLGITEERLGHLQEARDAYAKYLTLTKNTEKSKSVSVHLAEVDSKLDRFLRYKWGRQSAGLLLGYSPTFNSKAQEELNSEMRTAYDFGIAFGALSLGYKRGVGTSGAFRAPTSTSANATYATVAAGSRHVVEEWYFKYDIALTEEADTKPVVWSIPLSAAVISNGTRLTSGKLYHNWGYDMATGLGVSFYTKSAFAFDLTALYHLGIPFGDVTADGEQSGIKTLSGQDVTCSTTGSEIRIGMRILFGKNPPSED